MIISICQRVPGIKKVTVNHFTAHILKNSDRSFPWSPPGKKAVEEGTSSGWKSPSLNLGGFESQWLGSRGRSLVHPYLCFFHSHPSQCFCGARMSSGGHLSALALPPVSVVRRQAWGVPAWRREAPAEPKLLLKPCLIIAPRARSRAGDPPPHTAAPRRAHELQQRASGGLARSSSVP